MTVDGMWDGEREKVNHRSGSGCGAQERKEGLRRSSLSVWPVDNDEDREGAI